MHLNYIKYFYLCIYVVFYIAYAYLYIIYVYEYNGENKNLTFGGKQ